MVRGFMSRLLGGPELEVLGMIVELANKCSSAVDLLLAATRSKVEDRHEDAARNVDAVSRLEEEADDVRRKIMDEIAKGTLPPLSREDFTLLTMHLDMVADWSKDAGRILKVLSFDGFSPGVRQNFVALAETARKCASILEEAVEAMNKNFERALALCYNAEEAEEEADAEYFHALGLIAGSKASAGQLLLVEKFLTMLEKIADTCEDTVDVVRVVVVGSIR